MSRPGGAWVADGRAKAIRADCEASLAALDGLPIDLYLLHAPDPRTPWRTSVRALARLADDALVRRIGLANVNRTQLDEALELAPVAAVQVALVAVRRPSSARRGRRALRGARDRAARAFAARRAEARRTGRRGGDARVASEPVAGDRPDPRGAATRDRALGGPGRRRDAAACAGSSAPLVSADSDRRGGRPRDGISGCGEEPDRRRLHRPRLCPVEPRRARRVAARARRRARRGAGRRRSASGARQHLPHARVAERGDRGGGAATGFRPAASGSRRRWPRRRSIWSSACSSASGRCRLPPSSGS